MAEEQKPSVEDIAMWAAQSPGLRLSAVESVMASAPLNPTAVWISPVISIHTDRRVEVRPSGDGDTLVEEYRKRPIGVSNALDAGCDEHGFATWGPR